MAKLSITGRTSVQSGTVGNCGNPGCGSFVKIGDLPVVQGDTAQEHRIACPQCCTEWELIESNGFDGELSVYVVQNEHRRDRSGKIRAVSNLDESCGIEDDPDIARVREIVAAREQLDRELESACAAVVGRYSLRVVDGAGALPFSRSTVARLAAAGRARETVAAINDVPEF